MNENYRLKWVNIQWNSTRNPYQVRHTYASTLLTAGQNPWYVAAQLGHEDVEMVYRTYGKFIREDYQKPKVPLRSVV